MTHTGKSHSATLWTNAILDFEVAALHSDFNSVARERQNATFADWRFAVKDGLR